MSNKDINRLLVRRQIGANPEDSAAVAEAMECSRRRRQQASAFKQAVLAEVRLLRLEIEKRGIQLQEELLLNPRVNSTPDDATATLPHPGNPINIAVQNVTGNVGNYQNSRKNIQQLNIGSSSSHSGKAPASLNFPSSGGVIGMQMQSTNSNMALTGAASITNVGINNAISLSGTSSTTAGMHEIARSNPLAPALAQDPITVPVPVPVPVLAPAIQTTSISNGGSRASFATKGKTTLANSSNRYQSRVDSSSPQLDIGTTNSNLAMGMGIGNSMSMNMNMNIASIQAMQALNPMQQGTVTAIAPNLSSQISTASTNAFTSGIPQGLADISDIFAAGSANLLQGARLVQSLAPTDGHIPSHIRLDPTLSLNSSSDAPAGLISAGSTQTLSSLANLYSSVGAGAPILGAMGAGHVPLLQSGSFHAFNSAAFSGPVQLGAAGQLGVASGLYDTTSSNSTSTSINQAYSSSTLHNSRGRDSAQPQQLDSAVASVSHAQSAPPLAQLSAQHKRPTLAVAVETKGPSALSAYPVNPSPPVSVSQALSYSLPQSEGILQKPIDSSNPFFGSKEASPQMNSKLLVPASIKQTVVAPKLKEVRVASVSELMNENFGSILKRRESTAAKLSSIEKRNFITLNPLLPELPKNKTHWDFLIDEIQWMSIDFRQERRWKSTLAKSVSLIAAEVVSTNTMKNASLSIEENVELKETKKAIASKISCIIEAWSQNIESSPSVYHPLKRFIEVSESAQIEDPLNQDTPRLHLFDSADMESIDKRAKTCLSHSIYAIAGALPEFDTSVFLHDHQISALKAVTAVNTSGLGALLFGKRWTGKTFMICAYLRLWLLKAKSGVSESAKPVMRQVLLLISRRNVKRWIFEINRIVGNLKIYVWCSSSVEASWANADILICTLESLIANLTPSTISSFTKNWLGVVVDVRGLHPEILTVQVNSINLGKASKNLINISHWLTVVSNCFPTGDVNRCFLSEQNLVPSFDPESEFTNAASYSKSLIAGLLSFVAPNTVGPYAQEWLDWSEEKNKRIDVLPTYLPWELINRVNIILSLSRHAVFGDKTIDAIEVERTKMQEAFCPVSFPSITSKNSFICTLQHNEKTVNEAAFAVDKCDLVNEVSDHSMKEADVVNTVETKDTLSSPYIVPEVLIKEEYVALDMDALQFRKYLSVLEALVLQSAFVGDNMRLLAKAIVLIQRVCFHEGLVHVIDTSDSPTSRKDLSGDSEHSILKYSSEGNDIHEFISAEIDSPDLPNMPNKSSNENLDLFDTASSEGFNCQPLDEFDMHPRRPLHPPTDFFPGLSRPCISASPSFLLYKDKLEETGSCKLKALSDTLSTYKNKHVVILTATDDELLLVHQHLLQKDIQHVFPGSHGCDKIEKNFNWYISQEHILTFNTSATVKVLLLTSMHFSYECNLLPTAADVILILNESWSVETKLRQSFQLGRFSYSMDADIPANLSNNEKKLTHRSLTIVRFYARGTLEEAIVRCGGNLSCLQGRKINELHPTQLSWIFCPPGVTKLTNDSGLGITMSMGVLNLAPALSKSYKLKRDKIIDSSAPGQPLAAVDEGKKIGIGKGKGKGLLMQGPRGGAVVALASFNSFPFASIVRDAEEKNTFDYTALSWLKALGNEITETEIKFSRCYFDIYERFWPDNILSIYNKIDHKSAHDGHKSILREEWLDCSIEDYNCLPIILSFKVGCFRRTNLSYTEENTLKYVVPNCISLDIESLTQQGIGMSPIARNMLSMFQVSSTTKYTNGETTENALIQESNFRFIAQQLHRQGLSIDHFLYTHPLQHAYATDINRHQSYYNGHLVNSQFALKYIFKAGNKSQRKIKSQIKLDPRKRLIEVPIGTDLNFVNDNSRSHEELPVSGYVSKFCYYPYGPKPLPSVRKPLKMVRESDISLEPWAEEEDKYLLSLIKRFGKNSWWLVERSFLCFLGDNSKVRSARQLRERYFNIISLRSANETDCIHESYRFVKEDNLDSLSSEVPKESLKSMIDTAVLSCIDNKSDRFLEPAIPESEFDHNFEFFSPSEVLKKI